VLAGALLLEHRAHAHDDDEERDHEPHGDLGVAHAALPAAAASSGAFRGRCHRAAREEADVRRDVTLVSPRRIVVLRQVHPRHLRVLVVREVPVEVHDPRAIDGVHVEVERAVHDGERGLVRVAEVVLARPQHGHGRVAEEPRHGRDRARAEERGVQRDGEERLELDAAHPVRGHAVDHRARLAALEAVAQRARRHGEHEGGQRDERPEPAEEHDV
jgi:hypothetical protein